MQLAEEIYAGSGDEALKLDVYRPAGPHHETAVLLLHGGGWRVGDKSTMARYAAVLASHGFTPIAVQYRLMPKHAWPAQIDDVLAAIDWVRSHATELGVRPDRIVLEGFSAGAHLALLAAARDQGIAAVVAFYPPTRLTAQPAGPTEFNGAALLGPNADSATLAAVSPINHVRGNYPPVLFLHGTSDWLVGFESSLEMFQALRTAGAKPEIHLFANQNHEFCSTTSMVAPIQDEVAAYLRRVLIDAEKLDEEAMRENIFSEGPEAFAARLAQVSTDAVQRTGK